VERFDRDLRVGPKERLALAEVMLPLTRALL
jgi:hypothetical protein